MTRSSVVLPQPEGPISEMNSPGWMSSDTCESACTGAVGGLERERHIVDGDQRRSVQVIGLRSAPKRPRKPSQDR